MEMGYLTVLHVRLGAKIGDLHAKDSNSFRNRLIRSGLGAGNKTTSDFDILLGGRRSTYDSVGIGLYKGLYPS